MANGAVASLDLAANGLDEYAGQELAHALLKNRTLTALDLTGNYVPEEWLRENHKVCVLQGEKRGRPFFSPLCCPGGTQSGGILPSCCFVVPAWRSSRGIFWGFYPRGMGVAGGGR